MNDKWAIFCCFCIQKAKKSDLWKVFCFLTHFLLGVQITMFARLVYCSQNPSEILPVYNVLSIQTIKEGWKVEKCFQLCTLTLDYYGCDIKCLECSLSSDFLFLCLMICLIICLLSYFFGDNMLCNVSIEKP